MFFTWNKKISNNKTIKKNKAMKQKWKLWQFCTQKCSTRGSLGIMKIVLKMKKKSLLFSFECMKLHEIFIKTTDFTKFLNCCISMSKNVLFLENPNSHFYSFSNASCTISEKPNKQFREIYESVDFSTKKDPFTLFRD